MPRQDKNMPPGAPVRLDKYLAERGVASRRACGDRIRAGRVRVNGCVVLEPGARIRADRDRVTADGAAIGARREALRTVLLNKPRGYVCSAARDQGRTVYDLLRGVPERLVPAGRLDKNSEGLLLLSNDGELIARLTHPRYGHLKTYRVMVSGAVDEHVLAGLRASILVEGRPTRPARVRFLRKGEQAGRSVLEFILGEGRKRQIRELCRNAGLTVHRLVRTGVGPLTLRGLKPGRWRDLRPGELAALKK